MLVGVSRTSKTPLSIYLGYLGQKAANVPIVKGITPPPELFEIDPLKIVGLTIDAERLAEIRAARVRGMGGKNRQYAEMVEIYDELEEAAAIHRRLGCPVIDVTGLSIEETAHRVVRLVDRRRQEARARPKPPVPKWRWALWWSILARRRLRLLRAADAALARPARARRGSQSGARAAEGQVTVCYLATRRRATASTSRGERRRTTVVRRERVGVVRRRREVLREARTRAASRG